MNIDHPLRETVRKRFAENAHKARQHDQIEAKLTELKNILIKYYPASESCGKEMNGVLFDIFLCESELASHNDLENRLFIPAVAEVERKIRDAR